MLQEKLRVLGLLLYKSFLVRKRHWKLGLFVEFAFPILLIVTVWSVRNLVTQPAQFERNSTIFPENAKSAYEQADILFFTPSNQFTNKLMREVRTCYNKDIELKSFSSEESIVKEKEKHYQQNIAIIFENKSIDISVKNLKYKILSTQKLPDNLYDLVRNEYNDPLNYICPLQLCLDQTFIKIKKNNFSSIEMKEKIISMSMQRMPLPPHVKADEVDLKFREALCIFILMAFLIPLCIETSNASDEKFLGVNVLMAMNGVPNYLNLLSWLISGVIFSLSYIVPVVILLISTSNEHADPFINSSNAFIFFLVLKFHISHLIAFGMHISAYFTRSLFMVTGILILYVGAPVMQKYAINVSSHEIIPYLGILFPNMLLYRVCEEFNYYETTERGVHWNNLFRTGQLSYGTAGSVGVFLIFSIVGTFFHFIMANYIYAINPGKYGVKKNPFYFLKIFKNNNKSHDYNKVENFDFNDTKGIPFEPVTEGVYTPGIQIRNLKKSYNISLFRKTKVHALRGVSVDFYQGQITALLGHNGAGKTTMMSILTGMISPSDGMVLIDKMDVNNHSNDYMKNVGLCPQENILFPNLSVAEQFLFFAKLKSNNSKSSAESEVASLLQKLKLFDKRNSLPKELSGGQKRRACLGMALIGNSKTLILDEPTSGLDPESRRDIWNILLKMRGEKTVLISTHDMEEADVLGDRIAIMHSGNLRSYGTSMFLKKLLGQGNIEVTLSTLSCCDPENLRNHIDPQSEVLSADDSKIVLSLPLNNELPDSLDNLERHKKDLGITGISVSLITLEQVFLKVTRDNDTASESSQPFIDTVKKLKDEQLLLQTAKALLWKKFTYTWKNISTPIVMLCFIIVALICSWFILESHFSSQDVYEEIPIKLDMYPNILSYYKIHGDGKKFGDQYKSLIEASGGESFDIDTKTNKTTKPFIQALLEFGQRDFSIYTQRLLSSAEYHVDQDKLFAVALYNPQRASYSQAVSLTLLSNAIIRTMYGSDHSISTSLQKYPDNTEQLAIDELAYGSEFKPYIVAVLLVCFLSPAVALFVAHPIREHASNVKQLQRMTGVSCFNYWGTMFLHDFLHYSAMILILFIGFFIMDATLDIGLFTPAAAAIFLLLLLLFGLNVLPLVYVFSFWKTSTTTAIKLLSLLPLGLLPVELTMHLVFEFLHPKSFDIIRPIQKGFFLLTPYISFLHGQISFFETATRNANCAKLSNINNINKPYPICEALQCKNGTCANPSKYFGDFKNDVALETSILALCLVPILYFALVCILEHKLITKLIALIFSGKPENTDEFFEEQVKKAKHDIAFEISKIRSRYEGMAKPVNEKTQDGQNGHVNPAEINGETKGHIFLVYELRKLFGKLVAVEDVSFGVNESECFGLLGVNGAGKSTTFKMMTGDEIPNYGMMYLGNKDIRRNPQFLKEMGYCPQNDAIIKSLNAYDHLRLFARIRGIPENEVSAEVKKWINRLNLNVCAAQPSGTYSGGNKRRLNIAIALIGIPNLVLMDEPTTGVDPAARRSLWSVIQSCQATGQAVILTSHSMEECEVLCNRLAIMVDGKLMCIGPSQELKQRFGAGYDIQMKLNPEKSKEEIAHVKEEIEDVLACEIVDENSAYLSYHVTSTKVTWKQMYDLMNDLKSRFSCIEDYSVLSSTLEQLFLLFARAADKSIKKK